MLHAMCPAKPDQFEVLYQQFHSPITAFNCGERCAPYNERGVPFCCDTHHAVPSVYAAEWQYLESNTDLWHPWKPEAGGSSSRLRSLLPEGQVLVECLGHALCQRSFRSITCRSFPFFPYLSTEGEFLGLSYYWEFEDRCWVISHLEKVTPTYLEEFVRTYEKLFELFPDEIENFRYHSTRMRRLFDRMKRAVPLLHRNGYLYKITPRNGRMRRIPPEKLPRFGPYQIGERLPFPDD